MDKRLPRRDFSLVVKGRKFTFLDFRMADRAAMSYETGHQGQSANSPCLYCWLKFGQKGPCVRDHTAEVTDAKVLKTSLHFDAMAKLVSPIYDFEQGRKATFGPEPEVQGTGSVNLDHKGGAEGNSALSETQRQFHLLLQDPALKDALKGRPYNYATRQIKAGIAHIRQSLCSIYNLRLTKTPIQRHIVDILHWIIRVVCGLVEFCDEASRQIGLENLELLRNTLVGESAVTGYDGRQSRKLLEEYFVWTKNLKTHPDYEHIHELIGYWKRCMEIVLMEDFGDDPEVVICEFESVVEKIKAVTDMHFEGKPWITNKKGEFVRYGCSCGPQNVFFNMQNISSQFAGVAHAVDPATNIKSCTQRKLLKRVHGNYEHDTLYHLADQMRAFGPPIKYSSWVIEAANKVWKSIFKTQVSWVMKHKLHLDSDQHPAKQALRRFLRLVHPSRRHLSMRETRLRNFYKCGACQLVKEPGHTHRNPACAEYFNNKK